MRRERRCQHIIVGVEEILAVRFENFCGEVLEVFCHNRRCVQRTRYRERQTVDIFVVVRKDQLTKPKRGVAMLPSLVGSHDTGSIDFQYLLCSLATIHIVSVAVSLATIGGSSSGGSPKITRVTANAD